MGCASGCQEQPEVPRSPMGRPPTARRTRRTSKLTVSACSRFSCHGCPGMMSQASRKGRTPSSTRCCAIVSTAGLSWPVCERKTSNICSSRPSDTNLLHCLILERSSLHRVGINSGLCRSRTRGSAVEARIVTPAVVLAGATAPDSLATGHPFAVLRRAGGESVPSDRAVLEPWGRRGKASDVGGESGCARDRTIELSPTPVAFEKLRNGRYGSPSTDPRTAPTDVGIREGIALAGQNR